VIAVRRISLRDTVAVQPYEGEGAFGPVIGDPVDVQCKASFQRQLVRNADGEEVVSELTLYVHPADESHFAPGAVVTYGDYESTVLGVAPQGRPGETVLVKVTCR
jgi:hypothetical protein